jgi:hypothetical protein
MQTEIEIVVPGEQGGSTVKKQIHNPLYSYTFTSEYATAQIQAVQGWDQVCSEFV